MLIGARTSWPRRSWHYLVSGLTVVICVGQVTAQEFDRAAATMTTLADDLAIQYDSIRVEGTTWQHDR